MAGPLSHVTLFCNDEIKLTIINRTTNNILLPQILINKAKKFKVHYIEAKFIFYQQNACADNLYMDLQICL